MKGRSRLLAGLFAGARAAALLAACACSRERSAAPAPEGTAPAPASASARTPASASAPTLESALAPAPASASAPTLESAASRSPDGGGACRVLLKPVQLPITGAATLAVRTDRVDAILDDDGRPRVVSFALGVVAPAGLGAPLAEGSDPGATADAGPARGLRVRCATAGDLAFCPDRAGAVHRARFNGEGDRIIASGRVGARVAAALLAGSHPAVAYLASRKTSEGWVSEAWLEVDDDAPVRLSEDGSGATSIDLVPRGASVLALAVDARAALTALHARPVAYDHGATLGEDAVIFVGGPGDHHTAAGAALPAAGAGWAFLPIAKDAMAFGLAIVRVDDPPRVDEPVTWSLYPNGLDPAPIGAAVHAGQTWVARVRPVGAGAGSGRVLELGEVDREGTFVSRDLVPTAPSISDVSLAADARGELWVSWVDGAGSWVERLSCR
jgi:hypothetical protein